MRASLSGRCFAVLGALWLATWVLAPHGASEAAELYLYGDFRGSLGSGEFDGYLGTSPAQGVSGENRGGTWSFAAALGVAQPLSRWTLGGHSLEGWALRGEIEIAPRREYKLSTSGPLGPTSEVFAHLKSRTLLANFWLDVPLRRKLSGYGGFGVGVAGGNVSAGDRGPAEYYGYRKEREFAFQLGGGLEYPLLENLRVALGYRYLHLGGFEVNVEDPAHSNGRIEVDLSGHELLLGLRLSFDILNSPFD